MSAGEDHGFDAEQCRSGAACASGHLTVRGSTRFLADSLCLVQLQAGTWRSRCQCTSWPMKVSNCRVQYFTELGLRILGEGRYLFEGWNPPAFEK